MSSNALVRTVLITAALCMAGGCAHKPDLASGVTVMQKKPSVFLRASPDSDGSALIGAWLPDALDDADLDESSASRTRCSEFIKLKKIPGGGDVEELVSASSGASAKIGVKSIANIKGERTTSDALRIKYSGIEKLQAQVDSKGLSDCCRIAPDQCSQRYISGVIMGNGQVFAATETSNDFGADGTGSIQGAPIDGAVMYKDGYKWERKATFQQQYFAFTVQRNSMTGAAQAGAAAAESCGWANQVPESLDGEYFVGVSPALPSQDVARDYAMRSAREQVVKYLGEWIATSESGARTVSGEASALSVSLDDKRTLEAVAEGVARMVKDRQWCSPELVETPKGNMQVMKVLAFFPHTERAAAAKAALINLITARKRSGKLSPEQENSLQAMIESIK